MAQRKINQEIDKCFKAVAIGVEAFDSQYEKYEQSTNASQRDKLVENIKKECKKLQRLRDQIKTWAAGNEVKDKAALQEKRELIETKMEAFKAVEKEMKTKAFSKEGLTAAAKLDPREKEKDEMMTFLQEMVEELGRQIESLEAETAQLLTQAKKSKKDNAKAERAQELEEKTERHKWHQGRLELLLRSLANDSVEPELVKNTEEDIRHYVDNNQEVDFIEDDSIYDDFNLNEEGGKFGVQQDIERVSSQDTQSAQEEPSDIPIPADTTKTRSKSATESSTQAAGGRRPSQHVKSPLPALATLHSAPTNQSSTTATSAMKPAPPPSKPPGETLKYASAAAAAAVSADVSGIGIAPLPPPPIKSASQATVNNAVLPSPSISHGKPSTSVTSTSPAVSQSTPATSQAPEQRSISSGASAPEKQKATSSKSPAPSQSSLGTSSPAVSAAHINQAPTRDDVPAQPSHATTHSDSTSAIPDVPQSQDQAISAEPQSYDRSEPVFAQTNGVDHHGRHEEQESVYHLPASLQELVDSFEAVKNAAVPPSQPQHQNQLASSYATRPDTFDAEKPRHYKPQNENLSTPLHYPQDPLPIFDDPRLYSKIDTDALFYSFYYRQGTYQQYLAAKALKQQSWRFHKQYQTWFQRHEEPKSITEDYEQGTYRFFDYESTWMNRRKADFKFAYKFLEDDL